jgi:hypothetical protein
VISWWLLILFGVAAQLPDYYVNEFPGEGRLISFLDEFRFADTGVWVVYPQQRHLAPTRLFWLRHATLHQSIRAHRTW